MERESKQQGGNLKKEKEQPFARELDQQRVGKFLRKHICCKEVRLCAGAEVVVGGGGFRA